MKRYTILYAITCFGFWLAVIALVIALASCAAAKRGAWAGGGAAAGAAVGSLAGPGGAIGGAAIGGIAGQAYGTSEGFEDGTIVGEDALRREMDRWRGTALAERDRADKAHSWLWYALYGGAAYLAWRNRAHLEAFLKGGGIKNLWHAAVGGPMKPKEPTT